MPIPFNMRSPAVDLLNNDHLESINIVNHMIYYMHKLYSIFLLIIEPI